MTKPISVEIVAESLHDSWTVEEEHQALDLSEMLERLGGIDEPEKVARAVSKIAQRLLQENPNLNNDPRLAVAVGFGYGLMAGIRSQRKADSE